MRCLVVALAAIFSAGPAAAATRAEVERLADALGLGELVAIMRDEGLVYARDLEAQMFQARGGGAWDRAVDAIYDVDAMETAVLDVVADDLAETDIAPLLAFFASERGREIVAYEISAREALMDDDIEAAAKARLAAMRAEQAPELEPIGRFVEANDLIDSNVMGAMNSNYAFYQGLVEGGAYGGTMTEGDILADVWAQEESIRADTDEWVFAYLALAYRPLPADDLEAYIAISETAEGRAMNRALFEGFDSMYSAISRALGIAAAAVMSGEDI